VKEIERIGKGLVVIPPKNPRNQIGITWVGDGIAQTCHVGPCHQRGEQAEDKKEEPLARQGIEPSPV
jgi:hypothetical protein